MSWLERISSPSPRVWDRFDEEACREAGAISDIRRMQFVPVDDPHVVAMHKKIHADAKRREVLVR